MDGLCHSLRRSLSVANVGRLVFIFGPKVENVLFVLHSVADSDGWGDSLGDGVDVGLPERCGAGAEVEEAASVRLVAGWV